MQTIGRERRGIVKMGHPHVVMAEAVVEVADLAWGAYERLHHRKESDPAPDPRLKLQGALDCQRSENQRLREALDELQNAIKSSQTDGTSQSQFQSCPSDLPEQLIKTVESPAFLEKLQTYHGNTKAKIDDTVSLNIEGDTLVNTNIEDPSSWLCVMDDIIPNKVEESCRLDNEDYMIVNQEDIVDGIALFMARCVASSPRAKNLSPEQLQMAISSAFANMDQMKTIQKLWVVGKYIYVAASWGLLCMGFTHILLS